MAVRLLPARSGHRRIFALSPSGLGCAMLALAALAQPGFAATAEIAQPAAAAAVVKSGPPPDSAAGPRATAQTRAMGETVAETAAETVRARPPAAAQRPRPVKAAAVHRTRRAPATVSAPRYRTVSAAPDRAGCARLVCGHRISWLFLGIGF